jgi:hypothetical protein
MKQTNSIPFLKSIEVGQYIQQGDVILTSIKPVILKDEKSTNLCHTGNNHFHEFNEPILVMNDIYVLKKRQVLQHPEHKHISLPEGFYQKTIVMEYDHMLEESREVID